MWVEEINDFLENVDKLNKVEKLIIFFNYVKDLLIKKKCVVIIGV